MLLLSSATRIFATERPPPIRCLCWPHPCVAVRMTYANLLEHPFQFASISRGQPCVGSEYCTHGPSRGVVFGPKTHGIRSSMTVPRSVSPDLRPAAKPYQGTIFFRPFFFLLVDSFLASPLDPFCFPSCAAGSVLAASLAWPAVAGVSSVLPGSACWPDAAGVASVLGVVSAVPFAEFSVVGGAFGSACAAGVPSPPSVAGVTFS